MSDELSEEDLRIGGELLHEASRSILERDIRRATDAQLEAASRTGKLQHTRVRAYFWREAFRCIRLSLIIMKLLFMCATVALFTATTYYIFTDPYPPVGLLLLQWYSIVGLIVIVLHVIDVRNNGAR